LILIFSNPPSRQSPPALSAPTLGFEQGALHTQFRRNHEGPWGQIPPPALPQAGLSSEADPRAPRPPRSQQTRHTRCQIGDLVEFFQIERPAPNWAHPYGEGCAPFAQAWWRSRSSHAGSRPSGQGSSRRMTLWLFSQPFEILHVQDVIADEFGYAELQPGCQRYWYPSCSANSR
jgi:hypothetical protein